MSSYILSNSVPCRLCIAFIVLLNAVAFSQRAMSQIMFIDTPKVSKAMLPIRCGQSVGPWDMADMAGPWTEVISPEFEAIAASYQKKLGRPPVKLNQLTFNPTSSMVILDWTGLSREDATNVLDIVKAYLCLRAIGHSPEFSRDSMLERVSQTHAIISDGFLHSLKQGIPDLPLKYVQTDPLYEAPTNGLMYKKFIVMDGEFAWVYVVPFPAGRVTTLMFDRTLYSQELLPKLRAAMDKVEELGKVQGRKGKPGYNGWFFRELDSVLTRDYGIKHIPCSDLNPHMRH